MYETLWQEDCLQLKSCTQLKMFMGEIVEALGILPVQVECNGQNRDLDLLVVPGSGPSLFGRNWLQHIKLYWDASLYCLGAVISHLFEDGSE